MKEELLFGAAYYAEYMPYERIDRDMEMMKQAGMNVLRIAESTWSTLEPHDNVFDFSFLDKVLEAAERENLSVIVGTPTYAVPAWLVKKDPAVLAVTKERQELYGRRQNMDIMNETFRFHAERVIRKLLEHTAGRRCVIGFQIDNETKHYGTASPGVQALFVEYLKETFGTTGKLNETFGLAYWSNSVHSWEDFPDMRGCINGGLASEFEKFQSKLAAEYLSWQADLVRAYKREDQFITHNLDFEWKKFGADIAQDGYSYGVQPDINHYEAAKCLTIAGTDIYHPTQDFLTGAEIAFGGDEIRSLKQENYFVLECQAQAFKYWTPYPGQLRLQAYSHLASGAKGLMYWNWHSIHNGYETYWKGLLSHDLDTNPTYEEACVFGREWKNLGKKLIGLKKKNRIALLVDNQCLTAMKWFPIDRDLSYNDVVRWAYDSLYEMNLECDVVDVQAVDMSRYDMIVTPALYSAKESLLQQLEEFVARGGVLVSTFKSFVCNEYLSVYCDKQPHRLHRCFGMSYNQFTEPGTAALKGQKVQYFAELLKTEGAESLGNYEHKYWGKYAGITCNDYGKGRAYYIGCFTEKGILKEIYAQAGRDAGMELPLSVWPVVFRSGENAEGHMLHYVLNYSENQQEVLNPYKRVRDLLSDKVYEPGEKILLMDWNLAILEEI